MKIRYFEVRSAKWELDFLKSRIQYLKDSMSRISHIQLQEVLNIRGFSLIELLIVLAIIATALGIGLSAFAASVRSSTKTTIYNKVKQNGDLVFETITRSVRGAVDVCAIGTTIRIYTTKVDCTSPPLTAQTRFDCTVGSSGANGSIVKDGTPLTNQSGVRVAACTFTHSATVPKRVTIDFRLTQGVEVGDSADTTVNIPFRTEVTLRNF